MCCRMLPECFNFSSAVPEVLDCDLKIKEEPVAAPKVNMFDLVCYPLILATFLSDGCYIVT